MAVFCIKKADEELVDVEDDEAEKSKELKELLLNDDE